MLIGFVVSSQLIGVSSVCFTSSRTYPFIYVLAFIRKDVKVPYLFPTLHELITRKTTSMLKIPKKERIPLSLYIKFQYTTFCFETHDLVAMLWDQAIQKHGNAHF